MPFLCVCACVCGGGGGGGEDVVDSVFIPLQEIVDVLLWLVDTFD